MMMDTTTCENIGHPSDHLQIVPIDDNAVIVYHTLLGNLHYAEKDILAFLDLVKQGSSLAELKLRFPGVDLEHEVQMLHQLGFLVIGDEKQKLDAKIQQRKARLFRGELIRALRLNISTDCNLACRYCYGIHNAEPQSETHMPLSTACKAIKTYTDLLLENGRQVMWVRYFGGEPLLNWPVLWNSLNYAVELAAKFSLQLNVLINTNATLLTSSRARDLSNHRDCLNVVVSLDGPAVAHDAARKFCNGRGSFDLVLRGLDMLQRENIPVSISATLGSHNQMYLRELIDLLAERGIYSLGIDPIRIVSDNGNSEILANALIDAIEYAMERHVHIHGLWWGVCERLKGKDIGAFCGGCGGELSIMPNGEIYPCQAIPIRLGTLDDVETRALFSTNVYHQVAMRVAGNIPECRGCAIEGMCAGGCAADALAYSQDLYKRTRYCYFLRIVVQHYVSYLGRMARRRNN